MLTPGRCGRILAPDKIPAARNLRADFHPESCFLWKTFRFFFISRGLATQKNFSLFLHSGPTLRLLPHL
jgi:hypothetical protein